MTVQNMQDSLNWWEQFREEKGNDDKFKDVFELIEKAYEEETEEALEAAVAEIKKLDTKKYEDEVRKFNRRARILQKRLERKVSNDFGAMLKFLRNKKELSLAQLSKLTGISASYISRIEEGQRRAPSFPIIEKLASVLGVSVVTLLDVASSEDERSEASTISQLIYSNNIKLTEDGELLSTGAKEQLVELINFIINMEWKEDKHTEMFKLIELLDEFK